MLDPGVLVMQENRIPPGSVIGLEMVCISHDHSSPIPTIKLCMAYWHGLYNYISRVCIRSLTWKPIYKLLLNMLRVYLHIHQLSSHWIALFWK